jgi:hypothetical protein
MNILAFIHADPAGLALALFVILAVVLWAISANKS